MTIRRVVIPEPIRVPLAWLLGKFIVVTTKGAMAVARALWWLGGRVEVLGDVFAGYSNWWRRQLRDVAAYHRSREEHNA